MGVLYVDWTDTQFELYRSKLMFANASAIAFIVALTQYSVSRWIWFGGKAKRPPHHSPVYLICGINFWIIWSLVIDSISIGEYGDSIPLGTRIAMPLLVLAGVPFNLAFCWVWTIVFPPTEDSQDMNSDELEVHAQEKDDKLECEAIITATDNNQVEKQVGQSDKQEEAPIRNDNTPSVKPKVLYINNIKVFLTNIVILYHVAMDFVFASLGSDWATRCWLYLWISTVVTLCPFSFSIRGTSLQNHSIRGVLTFS